MKQFDINEAMKMRLEGKSYADIGRYYKISRQTVRKKIGKRPRGEKAVEDIKIPALKKYFKGNNESIREFCLDVCGNMDYRHFNTFYTEFIVWIRKDNWTGRKKFTVNQMARIIQKTGASIEDFTGSDTIES